MISLFKYIINEYFSGHGNACDGIDTRAPNNLKDLLAKIDDTQQMIEETKEPQFNTIEDSEGCFYKNGVVTLLKPNYLIIDDEYFCDRIYSIPSDLMKGDQVYYLAYKKNKSNQIKICKIIDKIDSSWDDDEKSKNNMPEQNSDLNQKDRDEEDIFCKDGIVTVLEQDFVLINDEYICKTEYVIPADLKKGDSVKYIAHKNKNDKLKIHKIILKIESKTVTESEKILDSNSEIKNEKDIFCTTGIVTTVQQDYVYIDDIYTCETKDVIPTDLKKGDQVYYTAYKGTSNELKILKIIFRNQSKCNDDTLVQTSDLYDKLDNEIHRKITYASSKNYQIIEKKDINKRTIVGKVNERKGREIFLEDKTRINLDNVSAEFVPVIGDWIKLECLVEVNEDVANLQGEILDIEEIKPLRSLQKLGKVTEYNDELESGLIENNIVFVKTVCLAGYIPCVGDKVVVHCIESDQRIGKHWRALEVVPMEDVSTRYETSMVKYKPHLPADEINELIKDKENMEITNNIKVTLDVRTEKIVEITIRNNGNFRQTLYKCCFLSKKSESQLTLLSPCENQLIQLMPANSLTYIFKCKARFVGVSEELIIFKFKKFQIGRIFVITVDSVHSKRSDTAKSTNIYVSHSNQDSVIPRVFEDGMYVKGVKPYKTARFIRERPKSWKIPDILWTAVNKIVQERKTRSEAEFILADRVPCLQQHLNIENYKQRFDYLLYLEEIAQILNMRRYDMASAVMHRSGEFFILNVPGLAERRPSLIIGDIAIVSFSWDKTKGEKCYEGYIHKIKSLDIFLKFNQAFHDNYHGEDCQVSFKGSTTVLQRSHTAISMAMNRLGPDFLFPKKVIQKEPQFHFVEVENDADNVRNNESQTLKNIQKIQLDRSLSPEKRLKAVSAILNSKRLEWFNKCLNIYQKQAVKNILKGVARPLPYVIFGPPGTGKTITVCESILQILFTMYDSRILVTTPSNSSANLIAERLLKSKKLQPGDLVRLVAHHYLESDKVSDKLIPYCATADIAEEGTRSDVNLRDVRGYQKNVTLSVLCRSRIIVGTCSAVGILHNMGCKPGHFTHVIIDEAGQATEPEIMIPLILAHTSTTQVILAGDPKQLGPVNQSRLAGYFGLNDSFLVRLLQQFPYQRDPVGFESGYDPRLITKLLMNYRSLPELLDLPNKLFYEAELIPQVDDTDSEEAGLLESLSDMLPKRLGNPLPMVFHAVDGKDVQDQDSPSWYNPEEVTQVFIYLLDLYNRGLTAKDVGIITPYSKQVVKIKSVLAEIDDEIPKVGTVEEFQGQERQVIILSTVRTAKNKVRDDIRHSLGFVAARERLNVAITRARSLLIIIGNSNLLKQDVYWRSVLDYCKSRRAYIGK